MKTKCDVQIAGKLTVADWKDRKEKLETIGGPDNWKQAYNDFFLTRLETRHFKPISLLIEHGGKAGVGFSIVALQCSLIEFLASTLKGKSYKHIGLKECDDCGKLIKPETKPSENQYISSSGLFTGFLRSEIPFKNYFVSRDIADDFYANVRNSLFHEARTKNGWRILAGGASSPPIDVNDKKDKIVYRDSLQSAFIQFADRYGKCLPCCDELQRAFIRKFDSLCCE